MAGQIMQKFYLYPKGNAKLLKNFKQGNGKF